MQYGAVDIVDLAYEAAFLPELWPTTLDKLAGLSGSTGTILFTRNRMGEARGLPSEQVQGLWSDWLSTGWSSRAERTARLVARNHFGWTVDHDIFSSHEIATLPEYAEFFRPRGFGWGAATTIEMPTGDVAVYSIERRFDLGPVPREQVQLLDGMRPHLARAALVAARIAENRTRSAVDTLSMLGLPAVAVSAIGRAVYANDLFSELIPSLFLDRPTGLSLMDRSADALLKAAIQRLAFHALDVPTSIPVRRTDGESEPFIVHALPVRRAVHDLFGSASAILVVNSLSKKELPDASILQGLFDLTPAEARVARALANNETINEMSDRHGVSRETVRAQLKAIMSKTGAHRQSELAVLLGRASKARRKG